MADEPKATDESDLEGPPAPESGAAPVDELDPELIKLPRAKTRIRPIMAMAVIGICLTLGWRLSSDLRFSRLGDPQRIDDAQALNSDNENQFVELTLRPDRPQALRVIPNRATSGQVIVPVLGSQGRMWILLPATPWGGSADDTSEVYRGRLSRLDDMDFYDSLRERVAKETAALRPIALDKVRLALTSKVLEVSDVSGDKYTLAPTTAVQVEEVASQKVRILAVATDPYRDQASWSLALQNAGLLPPAMAPVTSTPSSWTFDVPAPAGLDAVNAALRENKLFAAVASEIRSVRVGTWADLELDGGDILMGVAAPGMVIQNISVSAPPLVAKGAFLLDTTEAPGTYWYVIIIVLALAAFGMIFLSALAQSIRRR